MEPFSVRSRNALVTGGNQGIGLAIATGLAEAGANVVVFDISPPSVEFKQISTEHGVRTAYCKVDVSSLSALRVAFEETVMHFCGDGGLDICIAAAGINHVKDFLETEEDAFDKLMAVNVKGVYFTCQLAAASMLLSNSFGTARSMARSIIIVASTAAHVATRTHNSTAYATTKSAVRGMVPELAKELGPRGVRVNSISPGYTLTNMTKGYPDLVKQWEGDTMLGTIGSPEDYVGAAVYLASNASRYVTAQDFLVDGGTTKW